MNTQGLHVSYYDKDCIDFKCYDIELVNHGRWIPLNFHDTNILLLSNKIIFIPTDIDKLNSIFFYGIYCNGDILQLMMLIEGAFIVT